MKNSLILKDAHYGDMRNKSIMKDFCFGKQLGNGKIDPSLRMHTTKHKFGES